MITITLTYSTITEQVKRSLSIIAKRSVDDNGELLFEDITLGSREVGIIEDFFAQAITELCAQLKQFVVSQTTTGTAGAIQSVTLSFDTKDSWNSGLLPALRMALTNYLVSYALYAWFTVSAPRLADKYLGDQKRMFDAIRELIYINKAPEPPTGSSYSDITGGIFDPTAPKDIIIHYGGEGLGAILLVGNTETITATTEPEGLPVTYSSSNDAVATVDLNTGLITGVAVGRAVITASFLGNDRYNPASAALEINVISSGEQDHGGEVIDDGGHENPIFKRNVTMQFGDEGVSVAIFVGNTETITATTEPEGLPVTYSSSNDAVATVNPFTGLITGVSAGRAVITASFLGNESYYPASATLDVNVINVGGNDHGGAFDGGGFS